MTRKRLLSTLLPLLLPATGLMPQPVAAQQTAQEEVTPGAGRWSTLRISKWSAAAASAAAAIYGFSMNQRADSRYDALERACLASPDVCSQRAPDGSYLDAALEQQYQEVRRFDRRARNGLLASQLGLAASVVLFVLDLRNARAPDDIIYEPRQFDVTPGRDGGMELRLRLPLR